MDEKKIWKKVENSTLSYTEKFELQIKTAVFLFYENLKRTGREPDFEWLSEQFADKRINLFE